MTGRKWGTLDRSPPQRQPSPSDRPGERAGHTGFGEGSRPQDRSALHLGFGRMIRCSGRRSAAFGGVDSRWCWAAGSRTSDMRDRVWLRVAACGCTRLTVAARHALGKVWRWVSDLPDMINLSTEGTFGECG